MTNVPRWEILDGLPAYGPLAELLSATGQGRHREGLVVRFFRSAGNWVGNFQRGCTSLGQVVAHPDGRHVAVVAGGTAYVVDADSHRLVARFGDDIAHIVPVPAKKLVLLGDSCGFEALGPTGTVWRSQRISWDGMRRVALAGMVVRGEAYAPEGPDGTWYPFKIDVLAGTVRGGSYNGPPM